MSILIENVSKEFNGKTVLDSINLEIKTGSLVALLGGSGSGKSTLLRIVAGFEQPDSGRVWLYGKDSHNLSVQEKEIGFVFQAYALFQHLTVYENIAFGLTLNKKRFLLHPKEIDTFETQQPTVVSKITSPVTASSSRWSSEPGLKHEAETFSAADKHQQLCYRDAAVKQHHSNYTSSSLVPLIERSIKGTANLPMPLSTGAGGRAENLRPCNKYATGMERNQQKEFVEQRRNPSSLSPKGFVIQRPKTTYKRSVFEVGTKGLGYTTFGNPRISSKPTIAGQFRSFSHSLLPSTNQENTPTHRSDGKAGTRSSSLFVHKTCAKGSDKPVTHSAKGAQLRASGLFGLGNILSLKFGLPGNLTRQKVANTSDLMLTHLSVSNRPGLASTPSNDINHAGPKKGPVICRPNFSSHLPFAIEKKNTGSLLVPKNTGKGQFMRNNYFHTDNLRTPGRTTLTKTDQSVEELLKVVELEELAHRYPAQLSGGQCQRVALARALAVEPKVLLLDEPFGALDQKVRKQLRRWIRQLHEKVGVTTIFVTHDYQEAMEVANEIVVLDQGRVKHSLQQPKFFFKKMSQKH